MTETTIVPLTKRANDLVDNLGIRFTDPSEFSIAIAEQLARAESAEELFSDDGGTLGWGQLIDVPVRIIDVKWVRSSFADGLGFFAVVTVADQDGNVKTVTSGAVNIMVQLARGAQLNLLDVPVKLTQSSTPTADGYYPQRLQLA